MFPSEKALPSFPAEKGDEKKPHDSSEKSQFAGSNLRQRLDEHIHKSKGE